MFVKEAFMSDLTLRFPVHTIEGRLLLPEDTVLTDEAMAFLISSNRSNTKKTFPLLKYDTVKKDLFDFLSQPPCHIIFSDKEEINNLIAFMERVNLVTPFLVVLDYYKTNDYYTYRHFLMVFALTTLLSKDLIPDYHGSVREAATGPAHDFGKICVPLEILKKTTPLTRSEHNMVLHHTIAGYVLLSYYLKNKQSRSGIVARDHHERKDGSGHPQGILQTDLMVEIVAVSDIYDALVSPRPYRPVSYDNRSALEEITAMAERNEVGWDVVKALVAHNRKVKCHHTKWEVSTEKRGTPPRGNLYGIIED